MTDDSDINLPRDLDSVALMFPSQYASHADLHGADWTVTIDRVVLRDLNLAGTSKKKRAAVLHVREPLPSGEHKAIVLNKTNANIIAEVHGEPNPHRWPGLRVTFWADPDVKFKGKRVGGLRVRARKPSTPAPTQARPATDKRSAVLEDLRAAWSTGSEVKRACEALMVDPAKLRDMSEATLRMVAERAGLPGYSNTDPLE